MTSGDGADVAPPPEMPATSSAVDAAVEAAALCYDSDDLLTQRRGVLPVDRSRPEYGHTEVAEPVPPVEPEPAVDPATPNEPTLTVDPAPTAEQAPPNGAVAVLAPPPAGAEQPDAGPTASDAATPAIAAGPPHGNDTGDAPTPEAAVPTAAEQTATDAAPASVDPAPTASVAHETSSPTVEAPDHPDIATRVVAPEPEAMHAAPTPSIAATTETHPEEPAAPPIPTNGVALHAAQTMEFLPVEHDHTAEPADLPLSSPDSAASPAGEIIELPMPLAEDAEPPVPIMATKPVVDDIAGGVDAPAGVLTPAVVPEPPFASVPDVLTAPDIPAIPPGAPPAPPQSAAPPPPAAPPPEEGEEEGATMTIIEHLEELRHRITISAISVVVGAVIAWFIVPHVVHYLETAFQKLGGKFFSQTILGPFGLELKLSFLIGLIIASPVVLFQIWGFVAPGLTRREKRYALPFSLIGSVLFAAGAVTGILIVPLAIQFLTHFFTVLDLEQLVDIDRYIMFIALIAVIFGITFELPIFMVGFSLLGIVNSRFFIQKFRIAIFVIFGVSMVITPGADLISPLVLGGFLTVLYWLGVLLIRIIGR